MQANKRQTLFFAATFRKGLRDAGEEFCRPEAIVVRNRLNDLNKRVLQDVHHVPYNDRFPYLIDHLKKREFFLPIASFVHSFRFLQNKRSTTARCRRR